MPALKHLIEELRKLSVGPDEVSIPGQLYNCLVDDAEDIAEENSYRRRGLSLPYPR